MYQNDNSNKKEIINDIGDVVIELVPGLSIPLKVAKLGLKTFVNYFDYKNEEDIRYLIKAIADGINYEDEDLNNKREKLIGKLSEDKDNFLKKLYNLVCSISDEEKNLYAINLYQNLFNLNIPYETFISAYNFLGKSTIYEINFAIKLYNREHIDDPNGYFYIKQLVNYNLIEQRWGVMNGPSIDPNKYELNEMGNDIIKSFL